MGVRPTRSGGTTPPTGTPPPGATSAAEPAAPGSPTGNGRARDLTRGTPRPRRLPETGRRHHIGAAPEIVPVHTSGGLTRTQTAPWQLADRTPAQLQALRDRLLIEMTHAAAALKFETAAALRDEITAVEGELGRRRLPR